MRRRVFSFTRRLRRAADEGDFTELSGGRQRNDGRGREKARLGVEPSKTTFRVLNGVVARGETRLPRLAMRLRTGYDACGLSGRGIAQYYPRPWRAASFTPAARTKRSAPPSRPQKSR